MPGEFALIDRLFGLRSGAALGPHVPIGIGDDCAAVRLSPGHLLLTSIDTFTEDVHFFAGTDPGAIGHKALAVNLSDLAACGAKPLACLMALSLPAGMDEPWLAGFARGFLSLAEASGCPLIGGDTTRAAVGGRFSVSVTVMGEVPDEASILRRRGAKAGDDIWVSGRLGAAALGVALRSGRLPPSAVADQAIAPAFKALDYPQPRVALGLALRGLASACIDISDGFLADLGHLLEASGQVGARLSADSLPFACVLDSLRDVDQRCEFALAGGDDYELCFTAAADRRDTVVDLGRSLGLELIRVGCMTDTPGIVLAGENPNACKLPEKRGYEHF